MKKLAVAILVGVLLGILGARFLFVGSGLSLIPWTVIGLALGAWCARLEALGVGAAYGFALAFVFMVSGYSGSASLVSRVPAFVALGVVGAVCGLLLAFLGSLLAKVLRSRRSRCA